MSSTIIHLKVIEEYPGCPEVLFLLLVIPVPFRMLHSIIAIQILLINIPILKLKPFSFVFL